MNTGDRIKQRRIELGLTADDLAQKIGKSRATIYRYENGDIENMPTPILEPLAKALDTTPADLMGWTSSLPGIVIERKTSNSKRQYQRLSLYAEQLLKLYDQLSSSNKEKVVSYTKGLLSTQQMEEDVLAAHTRTDVDQTSEGVQHDLDIMNDDSEWK